MRNVSSAFKRALYDGNRNYQCTAYITLVDDTELEITNARIAQGGVSLDDNVSDTSSFTALGSAIINALNLQINNTYEEYSGYDFTGASVILYISLTGVQDSPIKICTMTVEKASYNGMIITLNCLDNMANFDKPYTSSLTYPATLQNIVSNACTDCGVVLGTTTFPNYMFEIPTRPNDEALTYREVISYAATLAGCFARCNSSGLLELRWFDKNALIAIEDTINGGIFDEDSPYSTGDTVNGGIFNPWNTGDEADGGEFTDSINAHYITALSSQNLGIDDVVITGIQITIQNIAEPSPESEDEEEPTTESEDETEEEEEEPTTDIITRTYGTSDYVLKIENNPFITIDNIDTIGTFLQTNIVGLTFRYGTISHLNDPSIEAGDVAMVWDRKGNAYPLLITNTQFAISGYQTTTCSADTPAKNSATRFSALTKSFVENKEVVRKESNALETRLNQAIDAKAGMYETREPVGTSGAYIYYMHDRPNLSESSAVIKITNEAVAVTPNYQASPIQWYGLTVDGNFIANIMSVIGIDFDWGTGGSLVLGGQNNINGTLTVIDASGNTIGTWTKDGIILYNSNSELIGQFAVGTYYETQIGSSTTSHIFMDYHSLQLLDKEGNTYFYVSDLRGLDGTVELTDEFIGDGTRVKFTLVGQAVNSYDVYVNSQLVTSDITKTAGNFTFNTAPNVGDVISVTYITRSYTTKAYTIGIRDPGKIGCMSVATGHHTIASGNYSFTSGYATTASDACSHAEGSHTTASGDCSHTEGYGTTASGKSSHAGGTYTTASGDYSHTYGYNTTASGKSSHAGGYNTTASGTYAYACGTQATASGIHSRATGSNATASGYHSYALGYYSTASGNYSYANGYYTLASSRYQTVIGKYNEEDTHQTYAFIIGKGTDENSRSNSLFVNWNGGLFLKGSTVTSTAYTSTNPRLEFQNADSTKNVALIFTGSDAGGYASLTLTANTGTPRLVVPRLDVTGNIYCSKIYMNNGDYLYARFYDTSLCMLIGITQTDAIYIGRSSYDNSKGSVYLVGNDVVIDSKNTVDIKAAVHCSSALGTGGRTSFSDVATNGCWLTSDGALSFVRSATSGGRIEFRYNYSSSATSSIDEVASGMLRISGGLRINGHSENIGYYKNDSASDISLTAGSSKIIVTLSLNAGRWILTGRLTFNAPSTATSTYVQGYIGTVNADGNTDQRMPSVNSNSVATTMTICKIVAPTSDNTAYYLCARAGVARTVSGAFTAIRIQ